MTKILACPILLIDNNMRHKYTIYTMYLLYMVVISLAAVVGPGTPYVANWLPHQQFKNRQKISSLSWKSRKQLTFSILLKIGQLKFKILRV
jgi:hypothetical protein